MAYFGPARSRVIGPFKLHELKYAARSYASWHAHETAALCSLHRGGFTERIGRREVRLTPTVVLYRDAWVEHADAVAADGASVVLVELESEWLQSHSTRTVGGSRQLGNDGGRAAWLLRHVVREFRAPDSASQLAIEGLLLTLGAELLRSDTATRERREPSWLVRTRDQLECRYMERLSHAVLAADAGVPPVYLATSFRRAFGVSMGEDVRRCRVLAALDVGFSSQSHFTRVFGQHTGMTPGQYQSQAKV